MIHRFEDASYLQDKLLHNLLSNSYFANLCDGFQRSRYPELPSGVVRNITMQNMLRADPIYVSDDVMTLWEHAAKSFEQEAVRRDDLVVPSGFALLPRPFSMHDIHGKTVKYRAIAWLPISQRESYNWDEGAEGQGIWLSLFSHIDDKDDYWSEQHISTDPRTGEQATGQSIWEATAAAGWEWSLMHAAPVVFDQPIAGAIAHGEGDERRLLEGEEAKVGASLYTHVLCFWRLMSQLVLVPERLPRQARRQRERERRVSDVKVLYLRRPKHPMPDDHEPQDANYSHRFIVSGHWRKQPYGPKANPYYKQIWIAPFIKGDDSLPLIVKKRGVEFSR